MVWSVQLVNNLNYLGGLGNDEGVVVGCGKGLEKNGEVDVVCENGPKKSLKKSFFCSGKTSTHISP